MKQKFTVPIVFTVKAESLEEARENVNRLMRYGFESISEYERPTRKSIKHWAWAVIRGEK